MENLAKRKLETENVDEGAGTSKWQKIEEGTVRVRDDLEKSLELLRRNGTSIKKLSIEYMITGVQPLFDAIVNYCGETLTEMEFVRDYTFPGALRTSNYQKSLAYVSSFLRGLASSLPNLMSLKITYKDQRRELDFNYWDEIVQEIPSLTCLIIENFKKFRLEDFLRKNGQLERLSVSNGPDWRIDRDFLGKIDSILPHLTDLDIEFVSTLTTSSRQPFGLFHFKNLLTLKVNSHNKEHSNVLRFLSPSAEKLEEIAFDVDGNLDEKAIKMLSNYKQLKRLEFHVDLNNEHLTMLAEQVPKLECLRTKLGDNGIAGPGMVKLMVDSKELKEVIIISELQLNAGEVALLCSPIDGILENGSWAVSCTDDGTITIKKE